MCRFRSITSLPHSIFLHPPKKLVPVIVISLGHMVEKQSIHRLKSVKQKNTFFVLQWLKQKDLNKLCEILES